MVRHSLVATVRWVEGDMRALSGEGSPRFGSWLRILTVAFGAAALGACTQTAGNMPQQSGYMPQQTAALSGGEYAPYTGQYAPVRTARTYSRLRMASAIHRRVVAKKRAAMMARRHPPATNRNEGIASFYSSGEKTASGEKFEPKELTAAHRTLPFGTKLRVTNVATGQSVTVRVNDRGPFVAGRVVDVSHGAAESLGMVGKGITKVKLDVVD
jgi:rare lipoprotein A